MVELVYRAPVEDAIARGLLSAKTDLDATRAAVADVLRRRLAALQVDGRVTVDERRGLVVSVPETAAAQPELRRFLTAEHLVEFSALVPAEGTDAFDLRAERAQLIGWLERPGIRERVAATPRLIEQFHHLPADDGGPLRANGIRWRAHRIRVRRGQFLPALSTDRPDAAVPLFSPAEHAAGPTGPDATLIELLATDRTTPAFHASDFAEDGFVDTVQPDGTHGLGYRVIDDRLRAYRNWTAALEDHPMLIAIADEVVLTPIVSSPIYGSGLLHGIPDSERTLLTRAMRHARAPLPLALLPVDR